MFSVNSVLELCSVLPMFLCVLVLSSLSACLTYFLNEFDYLSHSPVPLINSLFPSFVLVFIILVSFSWLSDLINVLRLCVAVEYSLFISYVFLWISK